MAVTKQQMAQRSWKAMNDRLRPQGFRLLRDEETPRDDDEYMATLREWRRYDDPRRHGKPHSIRRKL